VTRIPTYGIAGRSSTRAGSTISIRTTVDDRSLLSPQLQTKPGVNTHLGLAPSQPFGGCKWSGLGVENGKWGLSEFTEVQSFYQSRTTDGTNPIMALLVE